MSMLDLIPRALENFRQSTYDRKHPAQAQLRGLAEAAERFLWWNGLVSDDELVHEAHLSSQVVIDLLEGVRLLRMKGLDVEAMTWVSCAQDHCVRQSHWLASALSRLAEHGLSEKGSTSYWPSLHTFAPNLRAQVGTFAEELGWKEWQLDRLDAAHADGQTTQTAGQLEALLEGLAGLRAAAHGPAARNVVADLARQAVAASPDPLAGLRVGDEQRPRGG